MKMTGMNNSNEPSSAPQPDQWYDLHLGSSFKDQNPSKFRTLRYEFKPASIDKNQRGTLHKSRDNKVTVGFQNIQPGKPKVNFEGTSEDCKELDGVVLFDGVSIRLERLHRAVKRLRHNRTMGESTGVGVSSAGLPDANSPPVGKGVKHQPMSKDIFHPVPVEVERIEIGDFKSSDAKSRADKTFEYPAAQANSSNPSPDLKNDDLDDEVLDIMNADEDDGNAMGDGVGGTVDVKELDFDINIPQQTDTDDEIADVDASDDEADKGQNAAEALRAQNAQVGKGESSSDSSSSESSGSGSGSSSSNSDSSEADSVNSI